jgi:hypothetical protein
MVNRQGKVLFILIYYQYIEELYNQLIMQSAIKKVNHNSKSLLNFYDPNSDKTDQEQVFEIGEY